MFIDTHCHLNDEYPGGVNDVIGRARRKNVGIIISATAEPDDVPVVLNIARKHKNVFCTIGFHPDCAGNVNPTEYLTPDVLNDPAVVGIGEIGLDYHERNDNCADQIKLFNEQLEIAREYDLPVAIHTRQAEEDTIKYLTDKNHGVLHCYTGTWDMAKVMLDRGFYFSASGILTFKNADDVREVFQKIPLDRIVIETDAPLLAPSPLRGKTCEPWMVKKTAVMLAHVKDVKIKKLESILYENTFKLYSKIKLYERPQKQAKSQESGKVNIINTSNKE